jgi:uncharacterized repeat protein (TIGR03803 family)
LNQRAREGNEFDSDPHHDCAILLTVTEVAVGQEDSVGRIAHLMGSILAVLISVSSGHAATYKVLHAFGASGDGAHPWGRPVIDPAGNIYGTTQAGGSSGFGTVFKLSPAGVETVLHNFAGGTDGSYPNNELVLDKLGNLYGVTDSGGGTGCQNFKGCGTVFEIAPDGTETILYSFKGGSDGWFPDSGLLLDSAGNLLGTTLSGGNTCGEGCGTVFKLTPNGIETVLYSFKGGSDGDRPFLSTLISDPDGNLYGTTSEGCKKSGGTVFKIATDETESLVHQFGGRRDGTFPASGLVTDGLGNFYGTTAQGGPYGCGSLYKVAPDMTESVLLFFGGAKGTKKIGGCGTESVPLLDAEGNFYVSTLEREGLTHGAVLEITPEGSKTILHTFKDATGYSPFSGLVADNMSNLYGTTYRGGQFNGGVLFRITP